MAGTREMNAEPISILPDTGPVGMVTLLRLRERAVDRHLILAAAWTCSKLARPR